MAETKKKKKDVEDLDFEIRFFENILKEKPDFIQALIVLAENYTKVRRYEDGLRIDEKLAYLRPHDCAVFYNLSCSYSLLHRIDEAFEAMKTALHYGYCEWDHLLHDDDLINLRRDQRFRDLLVKVRKEKPVHPH